MRSPTRACTGGAGGMLDRLGRALLPPVSMIQFSTYTRVPGSVSIQKIRSVQTGTGSLLAQWKSYRQQRRQRHAIAVLIPVAIPSPILVPIDCCVAAVVVVATRRRPPSLAIVPSTSTTTPSSSRCSASRIIIVFLDDDDRCAPMAHPITLPLIIPSPS
mgnify:CR=1 FL=1